MGARAKRWRSGEDEAQTLARKNLGAKRPASAQPSYARAGVPPPRRATGGPGGTKFEPTSTPEGPGSKATRLGEAELRSDASAAPRGAPIGA